MGPGVYVSGAVNAPTNEYSDYDGVNGWYVKKQVSPKHQQPRNWSNERHEFYEVRAVDHFYENADGYYIYQRRVGRKKIWYICGPNGKSRYMHKHRKDNINELTRDNWKVRDAGKCQREIDGKKDPHATKKDCWTPCQWVYLDPRDRNLRVVEYPN